MAGFDPSIEGLSTAPRRLPRLDDLLKELRDGRRSPFLTAMKQRVDALTLEAVILQNRLTGLGQGDDREGADTNIDPATVDDDPMEERTAAAGTNMEVQTHPIAILPGTGLLADALGEPENSPFSVSSHRCLPAAGRWVFRRKWNTESGGSGTSIPEEVEQRIREVEHGIRRKWNIDSGGSGTAVPEVVNARR